MTEHQMPDDRRTARPGCEQLQLTAERIAQLQARIASRAYASNSVLFATARAIVESGDL